MDYEEYLNNINNSKWGICLKGNNIKSTRFIEYLAFGTVPIIVDNCVNTTSYNNKFYENKHYISVNSVEEINDKINNIKYEDWKLMSRNGKLWYMENVHSSNSFKNLFTDIMDLILIKNNNN